MRMDKSQFFTTDSCRNTPVLHCLEPRSEHGSSTFSVMECGKLGQAGRTTSSPVYMVVATQRASAHTCLRIHEWTIRNWAYWTKIHRKNRHCLFPELKFIVCEVQQHSKRPLTQQRGSCSWKYCTLNYLEPLWRKTGHPYDCPQYVFSSRRNILEGKVHSGFSVLPSLLCGMEASASCCRPCPQGQHFSQGRMGATLTNFPQNQFGLRPSICQLSCCQSVTFIALIGNHWKGT